MAWHGVALEGGSACFWPSNDESPRSGKAKATNQLRVFPPGTAGGMHTTVLLLVTGWLDGCRALWQMAMRG